jgi:hypothetical protein
VLPRQIDRTAKRPPNPWAVVDAIRQALDEIARRAEELVAQLDQWSTATDAAGTDAGSPQS